MKLPFMKAGAKNLLLSQVALAALLVSLPSCSGGGNDNKGQDIVRDISPHDLIPEDSDAVGLEILGIHILYVGWEIGTDSELDGGDETESPLTLVFNKDGATSNTGTVQVTLPSSSVAFENGPPILEGTWYQAPHTDKQPNTIMYINFRAEGDIPHPGDAEPPTHCIATGENICVHLRTYSLEVGGTQFIGATMCGKLTLEGPFREENSRDGMHMITPTYDLSSQPCIYLVPNWEPEQN